MATLMTWRDSWGRALSSLSSNRAPNDPNHEPLADNLRRLRTATTRMGSPSASSSCPCHEPVVFEGQRLPASYANFYIANGTRARSDVQ